MAIFLVILSALLLGLSTQSGALREFAWRRPGRPVPDWREPKVPMLSTDAPQTSEAPEKSTSGGSHEVGEMRAMRQILHEICRINQLPEARNHSFRDMPLHLREHLFTALFRAQQSLPLPALEQVSRPMLSPNCKHPKLSNLLTGKKRSTPLTLVDMAGGMGGGPELEFLELRLLELQGVVDLMVVAESSHTFRGDLKPRQYQLNAERFKAFRDTVMYLDLEECEEYLHHINKTREKHGHHHDLWDIQNSQRGCLWKMLQRDRPNLTDDTIVIFSDLDEIPNGEMMMAMKHCEWKAQTPKIQFKQRMLQYNLRQVLSSPAGCFPKTAWLQGALLRLGWVRETVQKNKRIPLRFASPIATMDGGAMHLSYFGHAFALMTKGLQHGEGGALLLPTWFKPCDPTDQDILELLSIFRNDPVRIVRSWENKSNPLPKARPTLKDLQKCEVPWALQSNPRRYAAFWGEAPPDE